MNLSERRYVEERVIERGILIPTPKAVVPTTSPVGNAVQAMTDEIAKIIRPSLVGVATADDLDLRVEELLLNDKLFEFFESIVPLAGFRPVSRRNSSTPPLDTFVGKACVDEVVLLINETVRAIFDIARQEAASPSPQYTPPFPVETLFRPALYVGHELLPAEVQRAFLGRDVAQIVLMGIVFASEWGLGPVQVAQLCDRFLVNERRWLEFLSSVPGANVAVEALPKDRVDFQASWRRRAQASAHLEHAQEVLDKTGADSYFFVEPAFDDPQD